MVSKKKNPEKDDLDWDDFDEPDLSKYDDFVEDKDLKKKDLKKVSKKKSTYEDLFDWDDFDEPDLQRYEDYEEDNDLDIPKQKVSKPKQKLIEQKPVEEDPYDWDDFEVVNARDLKRFLPDSWYEAHRNRTPEQNELNRQITKDLWKRGIFDDQRRTQEQVIKLFKDVHGDRYDYSKTVYKNARTKVIVICRKHGEFKTIVRYHGEGSNCPKCAKGVLDLDPLSLKNQLSITRFIFFADINSEAIFAYGELKTKSLNSGTKSQVQ